MTNGSSTSTFVFETIGSVPRLLSDATNFYLYGPSLFGGSAPMEQISASGVVTFLASTPAGVSAAYTQSGTSLTLSQSSSYSLFDTPVIASGTTKVTSFGFQGAYTFPSGLLYLVHRFYDPFSAQFMSVDPALAQTNQPYAFVNDSPLNATDPLGLKGWYCIGGQTHFYIGNRYRTSTGDKCGESASSSKNSPSSGISAGHSAIRVTPSQSRVQDPVPSASLGPKAYAGIDTFHSCESRAESTIVKGTVTGSVVAAGGGTTDLIAGAGLVVAPEFFGVALLILGGGVVVASVTTGLLQGASC